MNATERKTKKYLRVFVRWMIRQDMPEVLQIEQQSFKDAWIEEDFLRCLRQCNCIGMVAEIGEKIAGFMMYEIDKPKLNILNFAVDPAYRRSGIGSQMIQKLINRFSSPPSFTSIILKARETNLIAQLFFRELGFRWVKTIKGYYDDSKEDAYLMEYRL